MSAHQPSASAVHAIANNKSQRNHIFCCGPLMLIILLFCAPVQGNIFDNINNILQRYGIETFNSVIELNEIVITLKTATEREKLQAINNFFNRKLKYADDYSLWNQSDYWATPLESINLKAGDCEDYVIAKYTFLKMLKISNDKLRLTYVRAAVQSANGVSVQAHMVLSYYPSLNEEPLILDNLSPEILPASKRPDLRPIFSFNDEKLWVGSSRSPKSNSQSHLSRWHDLLLRMRKDAM